jgi:hypothetical protein
LDQQWIGFFLKCRWAKRRCQTVKMAMGPMKQTVLTDTGDTVEVAITSAEKMSAGFATHVWPFATSLEEAPLPPRTTAEHYMPQGITIEDVHKPYRKMKKHGTPGPDGIGPQCLFTLQDRLLPYITTLFDACFRLSYFVTSWKDGRGIAAAKAGDKDRDFSLFDAFRPST